MGVDLGSEGRVDCSDSCRLGGRPRSHRVGWSEGPRRIRIRGGRCHSNPAAPVSRKPSGLQPAERIFQYLRAQVEGMVYGELEAKKEAVENQLRALADRPERVRSLTCWDWIERALTQPPSINYFSRGNWYNVDPGNAHSVEWMLLRKRTALHLCRSRLDLEPI